MKMIFKLLNIVIILALFSFVPPLSYSQQGKKDSGNNEDEPLVLKIDTNLVVIDTIVTDQKGNYVTNLKTDDFEILEDGQNRAIEFFQPMSQQQNAPVALVLALDLSGSLSETEIQQQRQAIKQFIDLLDKESLCALIGFNYQIDVRQNFTNEHKKLFQSLDKIKDYGGSTRIYDALDRAVTMLKKAPSARAGRRLRKVVLVITDGFDSSSIIDKKELIARANLNGVAIYSITIPSYAPNLGQGSKRLPTLLDISHITEFTGGRDFEVEHNNYPDILASIAQEFMAGYTLAYHPPKDTPTNTVHKLTVRLKRTGVVVRTSRNSYLLEKK